MTEHRVAPWKHAVLGSLGAATVGAVAWALMPWPGGLDLQLAGSGRRAVEVLRNLDDVDDAMRALDRDNLVIAAYTVLAVVGLLLIPHRQVKGDRWLRRAAWPAALGAPVLDLLENDVARRLVRQMARAATDLPSAPAVLAGEEATKSIVDAEALAAQVDGLAHQLLGWSLGKWVLLAVLLAWGVSLLRQPLKPPHEGGRPDTRVPPPRTQARAQAPSGDPDRWKPVPARIGISCSGGGVRSASFCLGALQALDDKGVLGRAEYVTAVSGGSYLAAAAAVAEWTGTWGVKGDTKVDSQNDLRPYAVGSPEENWFRRNSSYLASDGSEAAAGVARMLLGMLFNLALLWLVIFAVARPVGWIMSSARVHPELRAREPSARVVAQPEMPKPADDAVSVPAVRPVGDRAWEFDVVVEPVSGPRVQLWRPTLGTSAKLEERFVPLTPDPGLGRLEKGVVTILRQPRVFVAEDDRIPAEVNGDLHVETITVRRQPVLRAEGGVAVEPPTGLEDRIEQVLRVAEAPRVRQFSGTTGRPPLAWTGRDWALGLVPLGVAVLLYLAKILARWPFRRLTVAFDVGIACFGIAGLLLAALFLVLPWSVQEIPPRLSSLAGIAPGVATPPPGADQDAGSVLTVLLGLLGLSASSIVMTINKQFRRRPMLVLKAASVVVLLGLAYVTLVSLVQLAAANGVNGRLTGWGLGSTIRGVPDYIKWLGALIALIGLAVAADAHSWSVFPYYKRRLSRAFFLHRPAPGRTAPLPYEVPVPFFRVDAPAGVHPDARIRPAPVPGDPPAWGGPQLVVCAAANTVDEGVAAAGRRAVSFTFSGTEIGGPEVGYVPTPQYFERMKLRRRRDVTIPAAVAMSGAAVSPAMGKASLGPVGRLLAVLNVRLGVWLPNPCWVDANLHRRWWGRPGWTYFARELLGQFRVDHRYVYVSDGGHWENLGLVELFRRGCTLIYCVSAAGDGPIAFGTLGEAIALAREELGVEVDIELEPLRAPVDAPAPASPSERLFRRGAATAAMARRPYVTGTFTYPAEPGVPGSQEVTGALWVFEANITRDLPWDVFAHAERWPLFPDDSTADQLFGHRQFESYRKLGYCQVEAAFDQ
jgi:uncharacterized protein YndB with AHSA1/START domain